MRSYLLLWHLLFIKCVYTIKFWHEQQSTWLCQRGHRRYVRSPWLLHQFFATLRLSYIALHSISIQTPRLLEREARRLTSIICLKTTTRIRPFSSPQRLAQLPRNFLSWELKGSWGLHTCQREKGDTSTQALASEREKRVRMSAEERLLGFHLIAEPQARRKYKPPGE